jgi:hypothetical protein
MYGTVIRKYLLRRFVAQICTGVSLASLL